ncbi:MAG TPA: FeoB small GTPase domain-containing protein, partial [Geobacteraceae bacterium]|nr:FeoB small GTPase domain-containing protein [Geobacteraceae bacterium]
MSIQAKETGAALSEDETRSDLHPVTKRSITVAVAGNPNSGKSTLINAIAGTRLHVGNWPGVTVEKKEASFEHGGRNIRLVDLP